MRDVKGDFPEDAVLSEKYNYRQIPAPQQISKSKHAAKVIRIMNQSEWEWVWYPGGWLLSKLESIQRKYCIGEEK